jgi:hypothetical protein
MSLQSGLLLKILVCFLLVVSFSISFVSKSHAQNYYTKSKNGVLHFTNIPPREKGYKSFKIPWKTPFRRNTGQSLGSFRYSDSFDHHIYKNASLYGIDPMLIKAIIKVESNFNSRVVSPKGAMGVMQLMPQTARRVGVSNPYDPAQNIRGGTKYFMMLKKMFNGNLRLALAGYNAGEEAVIQYGNQIPPYRETINYVDKVITHYNYLKNKYSVRVKESVNKESILKTFELPTSIDNLPRTENAFSDDLSQREGLAKRNDFFSPIYWNRD